MDKRLVYIYEDARYFSADSIRRAIGNSRKIAYGIPKPQGSMTDDEYLSYLRKFYEILGVEVDTYEIQEEEENNPELSEDEKRK